ncbi:MAG: hypothetical protein ACI9R3_000069 [Verrucomicrobiales bacterium]|jgi:hypothetical protein
MATPAPIGFFALGRFLDSRIPAANSSGHCRIIPAADTTESNAIEAHVLGWLTFASWVVAVASVLPWSAGILLAIPAAFVLIQLFTVGVALVLEKTLVATEKLTADAARAWNTSIHVVLLVVVSIGIVATKSGGTALQAIAWIWVVIGAVNALAALIERCK